MVATLALLALLSAGSLFLGVSSVTPAGLINGDDAQWQIFMASRLPRLVAIVTAGMGMSVAGLIMQQISRNKFVAPSTSGAIESASLGILVATLIFTSASVIQKMSVSFVFSLAGMFIFMRILNRIRMRDAIIVPLIGIMFGGVISSFTTFIAYRYDLLQMVGAWTTGSFSGVLRGRYELLYIAVPVTVLAYLFADRFTLAGMGEDFATNLGLHYQRVVTTGLVLVALSTAVVVITVGSIPFLGLIVPNVVSILLGDSVRRTLPFTAMGGAIFVLTCDIIGRIVRFPYEIPIGLIVGMIGGAIFLFLIMRRGAYATQS